MTFAKPTDTPGQPLNVIYAEHILQLIGVLTGQIDGGTLQFLGQVAAPATAPTVTLSAGVLNGSYEWGTYWITGAADGTGSYAITGRTIPSQYSAAQTLANQQGTVSIAGEAIPTGVVGWGVVRNQAGGGTWYEVPGSEQFMNNAGVMPTSFVDNVADANLVTAASATNTTGTSLSGAIDATSLGGILATNFIRGDSGAPNPQTVANAIAFQNGVSTRLPDNAHAASDDISSYPLGVSTFWLNLSSVGWPITTGYGFVVTHNILGTGGYQEVVEMYTGTDSTVKTRRWFREERDSNNFWQPFQEIYTDGSQYVSFPGNLTVAGNLNGYPVFSALSGGSKIQSGITGSMSSAPYTVTFPTAFSSAPIVLTTVYYGPNTGAPSAVISVYSVSPTEVQFTMNYSGYTAYWIAIGN